MSGSRLSDFNAELVLSVAFFRGREERNASATKALFPALRVIGHHRAPFPLLFDEAEIESLFRLSAFLRNGAVVKCAHIVAEFVGEREIAGGAIQFAHRVTVRGPRNCTVRCHGEAGDAARAAGRENHRDQIGAHLIAKMSEAAILDHGVQLFTGVAAFLVIRQVSLSDQLEDIALGNAAAPVQLVRGRHHQPPLAENAL